MLNKLKLNQLYFKDTQFVNLMTKRIFNVLLVANPYDAFMLEDDGRIDEKIFIEYMNGAFVIRRVSRRCLPRKMPGSSWKTPVSSWSSVCPAPIIVIRLTSAGKSRRNIRIFRWWS